MKRYNIVKADVFVEFGKGPLVAFIGAEIIARSKRVLRVKTESKASVFFSRIKDSCHLSKVVPQITALSSGDLERHHAFVSWTRSVRFVERPRDRLNSLVFALTAMGPWMGYQEGDAEHLTSFDLVNKSGYRFLAQNFVGRTKVQQIRIMSDHFTDTALIKIVPELSYLFFAKGLASPLA
jgi:hypothetical protein